MTARGQLRVYLGAAPGVGKTFKMLEEGRRRCERGTDVVIGYVECHGRRHTEALVDGLDVVPRATVNYRGTAFTEMDLGAVLARAPEVALVDELAHTNVPGIGNAKRWQDVEVLLDAGITVITTVNVQHLESLNDVVAQITGVAQRETVPDDLVRHADQIELVDMTPEALRRRMAHGNIYAPEKIDAALGNYFRVGNLTALRELALLWMADKVDDQLDRYRAEHNITGTWETRERVVVALTGGREGDTIIRRAARIAARTKGADLQAIHVARNDGLTGGASPEHLARQRILIESLGGTYHQVVDTNVAAALLDFARSVNATQLVLGVSRRSRVAQLLVPGVGATTAVESGPIDVHLVTHEASRRRRVRLTPRRPTRQQAAAHLLGALGLPLLTVLLTHTRGELSLPSDMLIYLAAVVALALLGGIVAALLAALTAFLLLNFFFVPPVHRFTIAERENLLALVVFLAVAVIVAVTVDRASRRTVEAARARAEAETLSTVAGSVLRGSRPLPALLDQVRETFGLTGVTLLERRAEATPGPDLQHDPAAWRVAAAVGNHPCLAPADGDADVSADNTISLVLRGHPLAASDRRVVAAFAAQAALALRTERLEERAAAVGPLSEIDKLRTALLSAVSHDLRSPLASAKAAVDTLRSPDLCFSDDDRDELLATADESLQRLVRLVDNLLDMSRLQAGALAMAPQRLSLAELIPRVVDDLTDTANGVRIHIPDEVAEVAADPALLERALVNVLANALRYSQPDQPPVITLSEHAGHVEVRIIDNGPGIPAPDWERVFLPFQRLGDRDNATGVGLGLALSRGLVEAMGGTLTPDNTPGGGLTMTLRLPATDATPDGPDRAAGPAIADRVDRWRIDEPAPPPSPSASHNTEAGP